VKKVFENMRVMLLAAAYLCLFQAGNASADAPPLLAIWNGTNTGLYAALDPFNIVLDHAGHLLANESGSDLVHTFTMSGLVIDTFSTKTHDPSGPPRGLAIDSHGNTYVTFASGAHSDVQKYDAFGNYVMEWGGVASSDTGKFRDPWGIYVASGDTVYVVDNSNDRIQVFNSQGAFIRMWGSFGTGDGHFSDPKGIVVDDSGYVYVSEDGTVPSIQKFTRTGGFVHRWGGSGSAEGQFNEPWGLAFDALGRIYVAEKGNNRVQVFDRMGNFLTMWGSSATFTFPTTVVVDAAGLVYVGDANSIQVFGSVTAAVGPQSGSVMIQLAPPRPNPSIGRTTLRFSLPQESGASLAVYDLAGRQVAGWRWPSLAAGPHEVEWNSQTGAAGVMFVRLTTNGQARTQKFVHLQ
jgi:DNA-binding beta-propeller fold protein YncE